MENKCDVVVTTGSEPRFRETVSLPVSAKLLSGRDVLCGLVWSNRDDCK